MSEQTPTEREEAQRLAAVKEHKRRAGMLVPMLLSFQRTQHYAENVAYRIVAWAESGFEGNP